MVNRPQEGRNKGRIRREITMNGIVWEKYTPVVKHGRSADYDVSVSVTVSKTNGECLNFYFANKGVEIAKNFGRLEHSEILPNTTRIYFNFLPKGERAGYCISKQGGNDRRLKATFPLKGKSNNKASVIKGRWVGDYKIGYDREYHYYYIDIATRIER